MPELAPCGTRAAYLRHLKARKLDPTIVIDEACLKANAESQSRGRKNNPQRVARLGFLNRTLSEAKTTFSQRYPEEFAELLRHVREQENVRLYLRGEEIHEPTDEDVGEDGT